MRHQRTLPELPLPVSCERAYGLQYCHSPAYMVNTRVRPGHRSGFVWLIRLVYNHDWALGCIESSLMVTGCAELLSCNSTVTAEAQASVDRILYASMSSANFWRTSAE